ncbi:Dps family protein [Streptococcus ovuberis]|uniref:DNA starvation/stationary phase protection protein n=1 Tax=Streptococcus ovuberis TaxID=1936207 RepID=A0A7X6MZT3_9STRE|nr:Dps family protein [Streptococcus ovuberis]NKZ20381.1 DNA starvation/stationary phase protection protein [Streptococcus ovuberis]
MENTKELLTTKEILNQSVADLSKAHSILHQIHWYMRGPGFMVYHPKMDDYMEELDGYLDELSERLITLGGAPFSTLREFDEQSNLTEVKGDYTRSMTENLERVVEVFRYLADHFQKGLDITDQEGDDVTNGLYAAAKESIEKHLWMLQAELGQAPNGSV